jgi:hypothetical protein
VPVARALSLSLCVHVRVRVVSSVFFVADESESLWGWRQTTTARPGVCGSREARSSTDSTGALAQRSKRMGAPPVSFRGNGTSLLICERRPVPACHVLALLCITTPSFLLMMRSHGSLSLLCLLTGRLRQKAPLSALLKCGFNSAPASFFSIDSHESTCICQDKLRTGHHGRNAGRC